MIHSCGARSSVAEVVWAQILQGIGAGFVFVCSVVSLQAAVPHVDMAVATAFSLMSQDIGKAVGSAVGMSLHECMLNSSLSLKGK